MKKLSPKDLENIRLDDYPIIIGGRLYRWFLAKIAEEDTAKGKDLVNDAIRMHQHLTFTGLLQQTRSVWANVEYLSKGLGWSPRRVYRARAFLVKHDLIVYAQDTESAGYRGLTAGKVYTVLRWDVSALSIPSSAERTGLPIGDTLNSLGGKGEKLSEEIGQGEAPPPSSVPKKPGKNGKHSPEDVALFTRMGNLIRFGEAAVIPREEQKRRVAAGDVRGPAWESGKDSEALWRLIDFAKEQQPARYEEYIEALLQGAWALHEGKLPGMSDFDRRYWKARPHIPSGISGAKVVAAIETLRQYGDGGRDDGDEPSFTEMAREVAREEA